MRRATGRHASRRSVASMSASASGSADILFRRRVYGDGESVVCRGAADPDDGEDEWVDAGIELTEPVHAYGAGVATDRLDFDPGP